MVKIQGPSKYQALVRTAKYTQLSNCNESWGTFLDSPKVKLLLPLTRWIESWFKNKLWRLSSYNFFFLKIIGKNHCNLTGAIVSVFCIMTSGNNHSYSVRQNTIHDLQRDAIKPESIKKNCKTPPFFTQAEIRYKKTYKLQVLVSPSLLKRCLWTSTKSEAGQGSPRSKANACVDSWAGDVLAQPCRWIPRTAAPGDAQSATKTSILRVIKKK